MEILSSSQRNELEKAMSAHNIEYPMIQEILSDFDLRMKHIDSLTTKFLVGIPSGDYETTTFDVPFNDFIKATGHNPSDFDRSCFYNGLYRLYNVPTCQFLDAFRQSKTLIHIEYDDKGVNKITETDIEAVEDNNWHLDYEEE